MTTGLLALALLVLVVFRGGEGPRLRAVVPTRDLATAPSTPSTGAGARGREGRAALFAATVGAAAILLLVAWPWAPVLAVAFVGSLAAVLPRLEPRSVRQAARRRQRELPLALDLLAACWSAGATPRAAAATVAQGAADPLSSDLHEVAALLALGTPPSQAWSVLLGIDDDGAARDAYRALVDASDSGVAPVEALRRAAHRAREARRRAGEAAARTVAVKVAGPLGLCFLPAFVLLAIAPAVLGALLPAFGG